MISNPEKLRKFMGAVKRAKDHVLASPAEAYNIYIDQASDSYCCQQQDLRAIIRLLLQGPQERPA